MYPEDQRILVVDDQAARREFIAATLAEEGFAVTAIGDGLAALRAISSTRFAAIIAAADLPGALDGPATLRRARVCQPAVRALFVTDPEAAPPRCDPQLDDIIIAPVQRRELLGCVFEILHRPPQAALRDLSRRSRIATPPHAPVAGDRHEERMGATIS